MFLSIVLVLSLSYAYLLMVNELNKDDIKRLRKDVFNVKKREMEK